MTTLDWSPEDANLLLDHYEFIVEEFRGKEMDADMREYMRKLKTDQDFARKELQHLKQIMSESRRQ